MISQCFFIEILLEVINELNYNTFKSASLIHAYLKIIYDITSIFNLKFKYSTNFKIKNSRYSWIKTFFYDDKFYSDLITCININLLVELNKYLCSNKINYYLNEYFSTNLFKSQDYLNFIKANVKIIDEIIQMIKLMIDEYFLFFYYKINNEESNVINENITEMFNNDTFLFEIDEISHFEEHLNSEYKKMFKPQELIEILNLVNSIEQKQVEINKSWIEIINKLGIIGFWNFILLICLDTHTNSFISSSKQLELFYIFNLYLFNGVVLSHYFKNIYKNISPFDLLQKELFDKKSQKLIWFVSNDITYNYHEIYDYPSEINILSSIAIRIINQIKINLSDVKINVVLIKKLNINYNDSNIFVLNEPESEPESDNNLETNYYNLNCVNISSIFENITSSYLNGLQSYLTSHHLGREVGIKISNMLDKKLNFTI